MILQKWSFAGAFGCLGMLMESVAAVLEGE
ncbi:hypothetical protein ANAPRD1_00414 [Anaplasma phagocytophilum]|nr:hypothetical protein ANAPRD1_00414 [Anaplasma phagocytophilum]